MKFTKSYTSMIYYIKRYAEPTKVYLRYTRTPVLSLYYYLAQPAQIYMVLPKNYIYTRHQKLI